MRIVFTVIGYADVGLGHAYAVAMLACEMAGHEISAVCTTESALAASHLRDAGMDVSVQGEHGLADTVLALHPDLVVNDILDTQEEYVVALKRSGAVVVNFEDLGPGAALADLTVNAIYQEREPDPKRLEGPDYFCIRDEFLAASPKPFASRMDEVFVTFGGTDPSDSIRRVVRLILPLAQERGIHISIVTGGGYAHLPALRGQLAGVSDRDVTLAHATTSISSYMARADLAFSSAGRTVFELATMRVPGIIIASNAREEIHTFAREHNGMRYLGRHDRVTDETIADAFAALADSSEARRELRAGAERWDFRFGRRNVVSAIFNLFSARVESRHALAQDRR